MAFKNENIKSQVKNMPKLPGCYQYFDKNNEIIYIGKAKNLYELTNLALGKCDAIFTYSEK